MKTKLAIAAIALTLVACSTTQPQQVIAPPPDKDQPEPYLGMGRPSYMTRAEVITATQECEQSNMRPRVVYAQTAVLEKKVPVPIDVHCEPTFRRLAPSSPYIQPRD